MISVRNNLHIRVLYTASQIWERTWRALMDPYRPEQHYMRGPGPKYRAQHRTNGQKIGLYNDDKRECKIDAE